MCVAQRQAKIDHCTPPVQNYAVIDLSANYANADVALIELGDDNTAAFAYTTTANANHMYVKTWANGTCTDQQDFPLQVSDRTDPWHLPLDPGLDTGAPLIHYYYPEVLTLSGNVFGPSRTLLPYDLGGFSLYTYEVGFEAHDKAFTFPGTPPPFQMSGPTNEYDAFSPYDEGFEGGGDHEAQGSRYVVDYDNGVELGGGTFIDTNPSCAGGFSEEQFSQLAWIKDAGGHTTAFELNEWPEVDLSTQQANNLTLLQDVTVGITAVNAKGWGISGNHFWNGQALNSLGTDSSDSAIDLNDQNQIVVQTQNPTGTDLFPEGYLWENQSSTTLRDTLPLWFQGQVLGIEPYSICNQVKPAPVPPLAPDPTSDATIHILATAEDLTSNPQTPPIAGQLNTLWTRDNSGKWNYAEMALPTGTNITEIVTMNSSGVIAALGTTNSVSTIPHALLLFPLEVMRVWSDQLPGVEANYLADASYNGFDSVGTGNDDKKYIFLGAAQSNNFDGKGHIKAQAKVPDQFKDKILWRLAKSDGSGNLSIAPGSSSCTTYDSSSYVVTITVDSPDDGDTGSDYILVGGYDADGDGQLSTSEANIIPNCLYKGQRLPFDVKIVSTNCYNNDLASLTNDANNWVASGLPHAAGLLKAFIYQIVSSEATSSESTTVDRLDWGLDHPVGILFDASKSSNAGLSKAGPGTSITGVFNEQTQMSKDVANSVTINNWLQDQLSQQSICDTINQWFTSHPQENSNTFYFDFSTIDQSGKDQGVNFAQSTDLDLYFAFGKVSVSVTAEVEVDRGRYVDALNLTGDMKDLYDLNFDATPQVLLGWLVQPAASVQAGYNTLGIGGRVFRSRVHMQNSELSDFQFQFPD